MQLQDELYDPNYQKMVAAFQGDTDTWRQVTEALRDAIVHHAVERCPYYAGSIEAGVPFEEIPILTKHQIRGHLPDLLADGVPHARRVPQRTSGSSGQPLSFYRDSSQSWIENISAERFLRRLHGIPLDATMVVVSSTGAAPWDAPPRRRRIFRPRSSFPASHGVPVVDLTPRRLEREIRIWEGFGRYFLFGYATALDWIGDTLERAGRRPSRLPEGVVTTSETLSPQARQRIARVFECPVHSRYGSLEQPWLAGTLPGTDRYVFNPLLSYVEVVGNDNRPVAPSETGRVLFTDLHNYVMPLIRYDVDDLATDSAERFVGGFRMVEQIVGRSTDVLRLPSGRIIGSATLGQVLFGVHDFGRWIRFYQCAQTGDNHLELRVVWADEPRADVRDDLVDEVRSLADPDTAVTVVDVQDLERLPSGKAWIVRQLTRS